MQERVSPVFRAAAEWQAKHEEQRWSRTACILLELSWNTKGTPLRKVTHWMSCQGSLTASLLCHGVPWLVCACRARQPQGCTGGGRAGQARRPGPKGRCAVCGAWGHSWGWWAFFVWGGNCAQQDRMKLVLFPSRLRRRGLSWWGSFRFLTIAGKKRWRTFPCGS